MNFCHICKPFPLTLFSRQLAIYQMRKEKSEQTERKNLMKVLESPGSQWVFNYNQFYWILLSSIKISFFSQSSWSTAKWDTTGPLYCAVVALHLFNRDEWNKHRVALLRNLMALAHARATADSKQSSEELAFNVYKPYLLYFGLIQAFYSYYFKVICSHFIFIYFVNVSKKSCLLFPL